MTGTDRMSARGNAAVYYHDDGHTIIHYRDSALCRVAVFLAKDVHISVPHVSR